MSALTTRELLERLQRHYIKPGENMPGGIFLPECGWNGGYGGGCDAIYVGFTTTSGRILVGHELKVSRADWLNELNKPGKSDPWADQCHEWWLVVADRSIVQGGELPAGWGLMVPGKSRTRMTVVREPDRKGREHNPSWLAVRSIMARQDTLRAQAISNMRMSARDDALKDIDRQVELKVAERMRYQPDVEELQRKLKLIEQALGGQIDWEAEKRGYILANREYVGLAELELIAGLVRATGSVKQAARQLAAGYDNPVKRTRRAVDHLAEALDELAKAVGE